MCLLTDILCKEYHMHIRTARLVCICIITIYSQVTQRI